MDDLRETEIHRMDDDGAPPPEVKPRIGIAPAAEPLKLVLPYGGLTGKVLAVDENLSLVGANGQPISSLTWPSYLAWRKTKCRPFDYVDGPALATRIPEPITIPADRVALATDDQKSRARAIEEIDQATHELVGEVAELAELFLENGIATFFGEKRAKLIDECGDIYFCGAWALYAWGKNPLDNDDPGLELFASAPDGGLTKMANVLAGNPEEAVVGDPRFSHMVRDVVFDLLVQAQTSAGLTANAFKKLKFQRREQDVDKQVGRIAHVLIATNQILILANSTVEEALKSNQRKLDARFPEGYKPGVGGGIRTGAGK